MILDHMIQAHNLGAKFQRRNPRLAKSGKNVRLVLLAKTTNDSVTGVIAIPSINFFPGLTNLHIISSDVSVYTHSN